MAARKGRVVRAWESIFVGLLGVEACAPSTLLACIIGSVHISGGERDGWLRTRLFLLLKSQCSVLNSTIIASFI